MLSHVFIIIFLMSLCALAIVTSDVKKTVKKRFYFKLNLMNGKISSGQFYYYIVCSSVASFSLKFIYQIFLRTIVAAFHRMCAPARTLYTAEILRVFSNGQLSFLRMADNCKRAVMNNFGRIQGMNEILRLWRCDSNNS